MFVHRDIKPQNILVSVDGTVKVTDFGIARAATANTYAADVNAMGSVHYFSPEQARGGYVNEKSDIYSLGITMFEMATGKVPFDASSSIAIALKHLNEELPDIKQYNPNVTRGLEGIIRKATQKKADERYDNIDLMISDIKLAIIEAARIAKSSKAKAVEKAEPEIDVPQFKTSRERRAAEDKPVINDAVAEEIAEKDNDELEGQLSLDDVNGGAGGSEDYDDEYDDQYDDGYDEDYDDYDDEEPEDEASNEENEIKVELAQNIKLPKRSVGFDKYSKKLKLNNENDSYDDDYDDYDDDYDDDDFDDYYREFDEEKRQERESDDRRRYNGLCYNRHNRVCRS